MKSIFLKALFLITATLIVSCDKDYNDLGVNIVGSDHYGFTQKYLDVTATNQSTGPIQTNNLDVSMFGIYNNPVFGKTTASYVTQLELASPGTVIDLGLLKQVDSVKLYVPYYTKTVSAVTNGATTYTLDSIYSSVSPATSGKLKLSVYENNYIMQDRDWTLSMLDFQRFYSNQTDFETFKGALLNNSPKTNQNTDFFFNPLEHNIRGDAAAPTTITARVAPGMNLNLDKNYFINKIFSGTVADINLRLSSNVKFKELIKGIYLKTEQLAGNDGTLAMMNFKKGVITIYYSEKTSATDATNVAKTMLINMSGHAATLINNSAPLPTITDRLVLKGGEGSVALINPLNPADIAIMKAEKWLINEANLVFTVDQTAMGTTAIEPNRLFLYDANNKRPIIDYYYDTSPGASINYTKSIYGGIVEKNTSGRAIKYKLRLTNYLRNIVTKDSTNVKLGVAITNNVDNGQFSRINAIPTGADATAKNAFYYPTGSVTNPFGTILYGSAVTVPTAQRLRLEVWYTKPD